MARSVRKLRTRSVPKVRKLRKPPTPQKCGLPPLPVAALRWRCDPAQLPFERTDSVEPITGVIGQDSAVDALRFGLETSAPGQNIFVRGIAGTGRMTLLRRMLDPPGLPRGARSVLRSQLRPARSTETADPATRSRQGVSAADRRARRVPARGPQEGPGRTAASRAANAAGARYPAAYRTKHRAVREGASGGGAGPGELPGRTGRAVRARSAPRRSGRSARGIRADAGRRAGE